MSTIERITIQGSKHPIKGARPARKLTFVELASVEPKPNHKRLAEYVAKRTNIELAA